MRFMVVVAKLRVLDRCRGMDDPTLVSRIESSSYIGTGPSMIRHLRNNLKIIV